MQGRLLSSQFFSEAMPAWYFDLVIWLFDVLGLLIIQVQDPQKASCSKVIWFPQKECATNMAIFGLALLMFSAYVEACRPSPEPLVYVLIQGLLQFTAKTYHRVFLSLFLLSACRSQPSIARRGPS